jgi:hypothetical protein
MKLFRIRLLGSETSAIISNTPVGRKLELQQSYLSFGSFHFHQNPAAPPPATNGTAATTGAIGDGVSGFDSSITRSGKLAAMEVFELPCGMTITPV